MSFYLIKKFYILRNKLNQHRIQEQVIEMVEWKREPLELILFYFYNPFLKYS